MLRPLSDVANANHHPPVDTRHGSGKFSAKAGVITLLAAAFCNGAAKLKEQNESSSEKENIVVEVTGTMAVPDLFTLLDNVFQQVPPVKPGYIHVHR